MNMCDKTISQTGQDAEYKQLVTDISSLWTRAKEKAYTAVNTELLESNWETGRYIVLKFRIYIFVPVDWFLFVSVGTHGSCVRLISYAIYKTVSPTTSFYTLSVVACGRTSRASLQRNNLNTKSET